MGVVIAIRVRICLKYPGGRSGVYGRLVQPQFPLTGAGAVYNLIFYI
jgi:hypothetical protein